MGRSIHPAKALGACLGLVMIVVLLVVGGTVAASFSRTNGGQLAVVRNGGPFDNNRVRDVLQPSSSRTYTGLYSQVHYYPASQRNYTITSDPSRGDRTGVDIVQTPTSDGVEVGLEGTFYFTLTRDARTLSDFDNRFGTRTYLGQDGSSRHPYDRDQGWLSFLDVAVRPVIDNDLRAQVGNFRCDDLVSSCALVQNGAQAARNIGTSVSGVATPASNDSIQKVQDAINTSLNQDLKSSLGGDFFSQVQFRLTRVSLPANVQQAVNDAQAAFAAVTQAQAKVQQAKADALANEQRQQGYAQCPACAQIDELKSIPSNVTVYAPGAASAVPLTATGR